MELELRTADEQLALISALNLALDVLDVGWYGVATGKAPDRYVLESLKLRVVEGIVQEAAE